MDYLKFSENVKDKFDNVYAIHWKESSLDHIKTVIEHLRKIGGRVQFYLPDSDLSENIDFEYIGRYFHGKETDYPCLEVQINGLKLNCFLEYEESISLWFNDSGDTTITAKSLNLIKRLMIDLATTHKRTVYFVNEGESTHRYKIFSISSEAVESDYDLSDISKYSEEIS